MLDGQTRRATRTNCRPLARSAVLLACGNVYCQATATSPTEESGNTSTDSLEEVVVTGTAKSSGLKMLDASFSITTANQPEIRERQPVEFS